MMRGVHVVLFLSAVGYSLLLGVSGQEEQPQFVKTINVRLHKGYSTRDMDSLQLPPASVDRVFKTIQLPDEVLDEMAATGETSDGQPLPNMNLWQTLVLNPAADPQAVAAELEGNPMIDVIEVIDKVPPLPSVLPIRGKRSTNNRNGRRRRHLTQTTPDFESNQFYLNPAPEGIDAKTAWTKPGGTGAGIKVYDVEKGWNQYHEDLGLQDKDPVLGFGTPATNRLNHGTAVLGVLVGQNNAVGVKGICYDADVGLAPESTKEFGSNRACAIMNCVNDGSAGDVILLEMQTKACFTSDCGPCDNTTQSGCGPAEALQSVYDATVTAVANRFVVVAAAGNGNVNLDQASSASCGGQNVFNTAVRDSGAIIVGASYSNLEKAGFSTYGSRIDAFGFGSDMYTTGYGTGWRDESDPGNMNRWYRDDFSGTSSASPIVAGAAVVLQSYAKTNYGRVLTPNEVRTIFRTTGTLQNNPSGTDGNIGKLPNLVDAMAAVDNLFAAGATPAPSPVLFPRPCLRTAANAPTINFSPAWWWWDFLWSWWK